MNWLKTRFQAHLLALGLFVVLGGLLLVFVRFYEASEARQLLAVLHAKEVTEIKAKIEALVDEKRNATLAIALALSQDAELRQQLQSGQADAGRLERLALSFRDQSHYRNLWIRLQDSNGTTLAQSWPVNPDDESSKNDKTFGNQPNCEIRVDSENLGFHASSPILDQQGGLLGRLVVISHFNSIVNYLHELNYDSLVLVQPKYRAQLTRPISNTFIGDTYVANHFPNQRLLKLARSKGLATFIHSDSDFVLEPEEGLLVVNFSLFDRNQQPLGNILMFHPVAELQKKALHQLGIRVQLMTALALLVLAFVLYLFSSRQSDLPTQHKGGKGPFFIGVFLMLALLQILLLNWIGEQRRNEYLESLNKDIEQHFNYIQKKYKNIAMAIFQTSINREETFDIMRLAYQDPAISRQRLLELFILEYERFFRRPGYQLHFQLKNNQSFLRFHRPGKYGDDLSQTRPTVRWANQQQQTIHGFENDPLFSGFRSLFPLIHTSKGERTHLGSVEIAFSIFSVAKELAQQLNDKVGFLVPAAQVEQLSSDEHQEHFMPSPVPGFLYQKELIDQFRHARIELDLGPLGQLDEIARQLHKGRIFSRSDASLRKIYSFIPLENPVTKELAAVLVVQSQDNFLAERANYFRILLAMGLLGALFISLFSWRSHEDKARIQALLAKTQSILDAQSSIMVISDGMHLLDYNRQLLNFFGVPSGEVLRTRYACICEAFIRDDKFFHLGKVPPGARWLEHLQKLPKREHIVSMRDITGRPQAFALALSRFENLYIISFSNISDTMREHFDLAERVVRDKLTGAYNREFFAQQIQTFIEETENNHLILGCILFDIDHFKRINDTWGHARGDLVLIQIVQLVDRTLRQEDILIRWGGEEFVVLARVPSIEQLVRIAENLRTHIEADSHPEAGKVTCSFGLSLYRHPEPVEQTLERADQALYRAKEGGRNRVEMEL